MNTTNNQPAYIPIDCSYYDKIEETIIFKKEVQLIYLNSDGVEQSMKTRLTDTRSVGGEEFIVLSDGSQLRMDMIISIDGDEAPRERHC